MSPQIESDGSQPPPAKPTLALLPLHGCHLLLRCRYTHILSPLQGGRSLLFLHPVPQTPPWARETLDGDNQ